VPYLALIRRCSYPWCTFLYSIRHQITILLIQTPCLQAQAQSAYPPPAAQQGDSHSNTSSNSSQYNINHFNPHVPNQALTSYSGPSHHIQKTPKPTPITKKKLWPKPATTSYLPSPALTSPTHLLIPQCRPINHDSPIFTLLHRKPLRPEPWLHLRVECGMQFGYGLGIAGGVVQRAAGCERWS
jgi:hypothetical protein